MRANLGTTITIAYIISTVKFNTTIKSYTPFY